ECNVDGSFILGEWSFIGYKISENITDSKSVHGYDMTINFERKDKEFKLSGKSSINLYNGSYNLRSNKNKRGLIEITGFLTTKIGGSPKDLNYEHKYLENLSSVAEFQIISNKVIHLFTVNGDFRDMMIFVKK
ncbi:MAG TPA: META domain-containing protein, partial [Saprospiraceae bacterium]|nr:META domain-containing protein [Saprospiraceae bacterium]